MHYRNIRFIAEIKTKGKTCKKHKFLFKISKLVVLKIINTKIVDHELVVRNNNFTHSFSIISSLKSF